MAWAEQLKTGRWRGLYRDTSGRRRTADGGPFTTAAKAKRAAAAAEQDVRRRPGQVAAGTGRTTWGAWADEWWARRKVEPGTLARDVSRRATHLDPRWADERLSAISREMVQDWVDSLADDGLAPGTVQNVYYLFAASIRAAIVADRLPSNPCTAVVLPPQLPSDERFLSWDEVTAITHHLDDRDALLVWWLVGTGARWGEGVGAHRHRLELDASQPRVAIHEVWDHRGQEVKPYPKGRRKRWVPLPGWLAGMLREHLAGVPLRPACGSPHRAGSRCRSSLIFPAEGGRVVHYDWWRRARWLDACSRAGVGNVRIHDLRHTYASWLLQSGRVSIEALSQLMGHSSIATTQRYAHLADTQWAAVVGALDAQGAPQVPHVDHAAAETQLRTVQDRRSAP